LKTGYWLITLKRQAQHAGNIVIRVFCRYFRVITITRMAMNITCLHKNSEQFGVGISLAVRNLHFVISIIACSIKVSFYAG
jgi:hypothetical protein